MKHLRVFEEASVNEAAELGQMPAFLKAAGAKPGKSPSSPGEWLAQGKPERKDDCWVLEVPSPFKKDQTIGIHFFPNKNFSFTTGIGLGARYQGTWQEGSASDIFKFGQSSSIKGVKMTFTGFGGMVTLD